MGGADMVSLGVASFGHLGGIHYQSLTHIDQYCTAIEKENQPRRALADHHEERFLRELILQWKLGRVRPNTLRKSLALICRTVMEKSSSNGRKRGTWLNRGKNFPLPAKPCCASTRCFTNCFFLNTRTLLRRPMVCPPRKAFYIH